MNGHISQCGQRAADGGSRACRGFTLVEMLTVIAVIAVLAGMVVGLTSRASRAGRDAKLKVMRDQLVTAIEVYKAEFGYYPPDNRGAYPRGPINSVTNALYYELTGTVVDNAKGEFYTPDRGEVISAAAVRQFFGVDGFVNASPDPKKVRKFIELKSDQYGEISSTPDVEVLIVPVRWPEKIDAAQHPVPQRKGLNPWHYVSTNPTNNPGRFDLWAEFIDGNRVKLIGNWSRDILDRP